MRTRMNKPALLLSLLALAALGLVACGGDDDDQTIAASETETTGSEKESAADEPATDTAAEAKLSPEQVQELKAKLTREQVQELKRDANTETKLSREQVQALEREANEWARLFSRGGVCNKYMGQPICERLTQVPKAFQKSFADATVEDIESERVLLVRWTDRPLYVAAVKFSNGEVVVFSGGQSGPEPPAGSCAGPGGGCDWNIAEPAHNRRFIQAATAAP
jgi:hypothetical protein